MREQARHVLPESVNNYRRVIVAADDYEKYYEQVMTVVGERPHFIDAPSTAHRWRWAIYEEGAKHVIDCPFPWKGGYSELCDDVLAGATYEACDDQTGSLCVVGVTDDNDLILRIHP